MFFSRIEEITVEELKEKLDRREDVFILDVRGPEEYEIVNIKGYLIPLVDLPTRVEELDKEKEIIVHCQKGGRSAKAVKFLKSQGFKNVKNLAGGIDAWAKKIDPLLPRY